MLSAVLGGAAAAATGRSALVRGQAVPLIDGAATSTQQAVRLDPPDAPAEWTSGSIGSSQQGRPITAWTLKPEDATLHVIVLSGIHGNERITHPFADSLRLAARPAEVALTIVPTVNPDGWASGRRRNANGVDLNRNFPWRWSSPDGGPAPGSEPETQAMMDLLLTERPDLVVWIHQPLDYIVALFGCPPEYAQTWAAAAGVRIHSGFDQHGGGETWAARVANLPSMLLEIPTWRTDQVLIDRHRTAFEKLLTVVRPTDQ